MHRCSLSVGRLATTGRRGLLIWLHWICLFMPWVWADGLQVQPFWISSSSQWTSGFEDCSISVPSAAITCPLSCCFASGYRFGEADHPGPTHLDDRQATASSTSLDFQRLRVGCSNPCGLRGKELSAISLGPGIWTHMPRKIEIMP